jgi:TPR repeat protein
MKRTLLAIVFLLLAATSYAHAGKRNDLNAELLPAQKALAAGDYKKSYALYARFAGSNPLAQFTLALFHQEGWGRPVDHAMACHHFEQAAHGKVPAAQQFFGDCLAKGIDRPADGKAALEWYGKAAAGGAVMALCSAADVYIKGEGVPRDAARGLAMCTQAAQANSVPAMLKLANYYRDDKDVPQNMTAARYWYQQAAERHSHEAQYRLGIMLSEGQGGPADPKTALFWLETAASEGYAPAYLPTAILYANAKPDPKTGALAPEYLAKIYMWDSAAKAGTTDPAQLAEIDRIEAMVLAVMPPAWRPGLDQKVAAHLAQYGPRDR